MAAPEELRVVFVAPCAMDTTLRFLRATAELPGVRLGIISQDPPERFDGKLAGPAAFARIENALDPNALVGAVTKVGRELGGPAQRLLGVLEQLQEPIAAVRERLSIRGMDEREATNFRDKARMKEVLRAHGLPCARHALVTDLEGALAFARETLPLVAKPPAGAGSRGTARIGSIEELSSYLAASPPSKKEPLLLEEFIQGEEHSFDSISVGGRHVFHSVTRYLQTPLEVMEHPWLQWAVILPRHIEGDEYDAIHQAGPRALDVLGMVTGLTHMEWFRRADGSIAISEVAARPPGAQFTTLLSYAHDFDFYRAWARLQVFEAFEPPKRHFACGAVFLRGRGKGARISRIQGIDELRGELGPVLVEAKLPRPGDPVGEDYTGDGYVILRHPETAVVERGLGLVQKGLRLERGGE